LFQTTITTIKIIIINTKAIIAISQGSILNFRKLKFSLRLAVLEEPTRRDISAERLEIVERILTSLKYLEDDGLREEADELDERVGK